MENKALSGEIMIYGIKDSKGNRTIGRQQMRNSKMMQGRIKKLTLDVLHVDSLTLASNTKIFFRQFPIISRNYLHSQTNIKQTSVTEI